MASRNSGSAALSAPLQHVVARNPTFSVLSARLRAEEPSRYVFAVFYQDPEVLAKPARYKLVAVDRDGEDDDVEELVTSPDSPYWIRGRK